VNGKMRFRRQIVVTIITVFVYRQYNRFSGHICWSAVINIQIISEIRKIHIFYNFCQVINKQKARQRIFKLRFKKKYMLVIIITYINLMSRNMITIYKHIGRKAQSGSTSNLDDFDVLPKIMTTLSKNQQNF
jgi:predicted nucleotide-binding protein (sugar kinase/HSP70/actin superfamily)